MTDRVLSGRYRLVEPIGEGGMGRVWLARDGLLDRDVAVKEVRPPSGMSEAEREQLSERALREARAAAQLDHPGIVAVHDVLSEGGRPWIVMEFVPGRSLGRAIKEDGPLAPSRAAELGLRVLEALRAAHERGILHRDVKPNNILLAGDGRVLLADFGIASLEGDPSLTRTGELVGSPAFIAPERLREEAAGPKSDLWSLGATLYAAVEGRGPFARDDPMAVLGAVLTEEPPPPWRAGSLAPLLWHLLRKDPQRRLPAPVAAEVLRRVATGRPAGLPMPAGALLPPGASGTHGVPETHGVPGSPGPVPPHGPPTLPASRPARGRGPVLWAIAAAAVVIVAAAVTVTALLPDGRTSGRTGSAKSSAAAPSTAAPGSGSAPASRPPGRGQARYVKPFDFCSLLTREQVERLIPRAGKLSTGYDHGCGWGSKARKQGVSVIAELVWDAETGSPLDDPWTATVAEARASFDRPRPGARKGCGRAWGWDEIGVRRVGACGSGRRDVSGPADEAYASDTRHPSTGRVEASEIIFRSSNLVLQVEYISAAGVTDDGGVRQGARRAADWIEQALGRVA